MRKRSISLSGHRTSYSIEDQFQFALVKMAGARGLSIASLIGQIDAVRAPGTNLSSALRLAVLTDLQEGLHRGQVTITEQR